MRSKKLYTHQGEIYSNVLHLICNVCIYTVITYFSRDYVVTIQDQTSAKAKLSLEIEDWTAATAKQGLRHNIFDFIAPRCVNNYFQMLFEISSLLKHI